MLRYFLVAVAAIAASVIILLFYASMRPDTFRVERSVHIDAPAADIYPLIVDFHAWRAWSPYETRDPDMQRSYDGPQSGVGAAYAWEGDSNVGSGSMEIVEADEPSRVLIDLRFTAPMKARNEAIFTLSPEDGRTRVTWAMEGDANLFAKVLHIFIDMDKMVGTDFEVGLERLKSHVEAN